MQMTAVIVFVNLERKQAAQQTATGAGTVNAMLGKHAQAAQMIVAVVKGQQAKKNHQ